MAAERNELRAIVYQVKNLINGKRYIGVTKRGLYNRMRAHLSEARTGKGNLLHRAIRKYGQDNFVFELLHDFEGDYDLARVYEFEMICKHRPEYNLSAGGEGGAPAPSTIAKIRAANLGKKRSPQARANMSEGQRIRGRDHPPSAETLEKMRLARLGKPMKPEQRAKMLGRKLPEETRKKMSAAQTGRPPTKGRTGQPRSAEEREKIRQSLKAAQWVDTPARIASRARTGASAASEARKIPVKCLDDGNVFDCVRAAAKFYGHDAVQLSRAIRVGRPYGGKSFEKLPKTS